MNHSTSRRPTRRRTAWAVAVLAVLALGACSGDGSSQAASTSTAAEPQRCEMGEQVEAPTAVAVAGSTTDWDLTSFDGTAIRLHWFPLPEATQEAPAPTVLMGPGWGQAGDSDPNGAGIQGIVSIKQLNDAGFNVLTWDPRGFGESGGQAEVDSPDFEGRDVQELLSWVAQQPATEIDSKGDPRVGMVGASYGGGVQLVSAGLDCRIDAIVPVIAWHSLVTSLGKSETFKQGWASLLVNVSTSGRLDPVIQQAYEEGVATGTISADKQEWFAARGPGDELVGSIGVPTLIIQGTVDSLFTLEEGVTNFRILQDNEVPVSMVWFCGGHGACFTDAGDPDRVADAAINWLRHYVADDESADVGATFDTVDQDGLRYTSDDLPESTSALSGTGSGTLALVAEGGSAATSQAGPGDIVGSISNEITPGKASNAVNVQVAAASSPHLLVGAPTLTLRYSGTVAVGDRPERVFAQLVDDTTGLVIGNQVTPIPVELDGSTHEVSIPLEQISFNAKPGATITLQLVATTVAYGEPRLGGSVDFEQIEVDLPIADDMEPGD